MPDQSELERRIQTLEKEVELLTSQIQVTLLDIYERLLSTSYPALRPDEHKPEPNEPAPNPSSTSQRQVVTFSDDTMTPEASDVRSTQSVRAVNRPPHSSKSNFPSQDYPQRTLAPITPDYPPRQATPPMRPASRFVEDEAAQELEELYAWAERKAHTLGVTRTCLMIENYLRKGRFSRPIAEELIAHISADALDDEFDEELEDFFTPSPNVRRDYPKQQSTPPSRPKPPQAQAMSPYDLEATRPSSPLVGLDLEDMRPHSRSKAPAPAPIPKAPSTPPKAVLKAAQTNPAPTAQKKSSSNGAASATQARRNTPSEGHNVTKHSQERGTPNHSSQSSALPEVTSGTRHTILRLIAGVQSTGIGEVLRRKKDG